jgi:Asp-tRNA(Asn)/Glu-tRNA(Gln) amidotransferase A subunit family amidase
MGEMNSAEAQRASNNTWRSALSIL